MLTYTCGEITSMDDDALAEILLTHARTKGPDAHMSDINGVPHTAGEVIAILSDKSNELRRWMLDRVRKDAAGLPGL